MSFRLRISISCIMNSKFHLLLSVVLFTTTAFITSAQTDSTVYISVGSRYVFFSDSTYKLICQPCDICPPYADQNNIISYGRYVPYGDNALVLTSDPVLNTSDMVMDVEESRAERDCTLIAVDIPAAKDSSDILAPHYFYAIEVLFFKYAVPPRKDTAQKACGMYRREYYQNTPVFYVTHDSLSLPVSIIVKIYPKERSEVSFAQGKYVIKGVANNTFVFHIPQFVTGFLNYKRMQNFVLEKCADGFLGDGVRAYVREDIYNQMNYSPWNFPGCPDWRYHVPWMNLFETSK